MTGIHLDSNARFDHGNLNVASNIYYREISELPARLSRLEGSCGQVKMLT